MSEVRFKVLRDQKEADKAMFPNWVKDSEGKAHYRPGAPVEITLIPSVVAGRLKTVVEQLRDVLFALVNPNHELEQLAGSLRAAVLGLRDELVVVAVQAVFALTEDQKFIDEWLQGDGILEEPLVDRAGSL